MKQIFNMILLKSPLGQGSSLIVFKSPPQRDFYSWI